jgi:hypothetical protein
MEGTLHHKEPTRPALSRIEPRLRKTKTSSAKGCVSRRTTIAASLPSGSVSPPEAVDEAKVTGGIVSGLLRCAVDWFHVLRRIAATKADGETDETLLKLRVTARKQRRGTISR